MFDSALFPYGLHPEAVLPDGAAFGGVLDRPVLTSPAAPRAAVVLATMQARAPGAALFVPTVLVGARTLGGGMAVTRAQTPSGAGTLQEFAGTWEEIAANLPRYGTTSGRLIVDPARTSIVENPRFEGTVAGTPGTAPSNWPTWTATASGVTRQIVGSGIINGLPYIDVRYSGTPTVTTGVSIASPSVAAVAGTTYATSAWFALVGGSLTNIAAMILRCSAEAGSTNVTPTATLTRVVNIRTLAGTTANWSMRITYTNTVTPVDYTLRIAAPQCELGAAASAPILPAVGAPAAATRGIDVPVWTPSPMPARGAILLRGTVAALAGASPLGLLQLDDTTDSNRIVARIAAGGGQPECLVVTGGVTTATLTPTGALAAGAEFRALLAGSPRAGGVGPTSGGLVSASVARPPGILRALLGQANAAGTLPAGGEFLADLYDYWPSEAEALAILAA